MLQQKLLFAAKKEKEVFNRCGIEGQYVDETQLSNGRREALCDEKKSKGNNKRLRFTMLLLKTKYNLNGVW